MGHHKMCIIALQKSIDVQLNAQSFTFAFILVYETNIPAILTTRTI